MHAPPRTAQSRGLFLFFAIACASTWVLAAPTTLAWLQHRTPSSTALACAGLSAFGPLIAAVFVAARHKQLRSVFGPWRTNPTWIALALVVPVAVRTLGVALYALLGGEPTAWFYPPSTPEAMAALVVFPIGEEFGWRGFAHPRVTERYGLVRGSLLLGIAWGVWHLAYSVTPQAAGFDVFVFGQTMLELPLYSLILAWLFERSGRSMAVAIVLHAAGHLDHIELAPRTELGLHAAHLFVLAIFAVFAARALGRRDAAGSLTTNTQWRKQPNPPPRCLRLRP